MRRLILIVILGLILGGCSVRTQWPTAPTTKKMSVAPGIVAPKYVVQAVDYQCRCGEEKWECQSFAVPSKEVTHWDRKAREQNRRILGWSSPPVARWAENKFDPDQCLVTTDSWKITKPPK